MATHGRRVPVAIAPVLAVLFGAVVLVVGATADASTGLREVAVVGTGLFLAVLAFGAVTVGLVRVVIPGLIRAGKTVYRGYRRVQPRTLFGRLLAIGLFVLVVFGGTFTAVTM